MPPEGRLLPTGVGAPEDAITPIVGTMLVFVIIFGGMAGALIFGVPAIKGLQDRASVDDMATQLQAVRREAERLTAEGSGASVALAPSQGSINLEEGTRMAVAISYNGASAQQGLALAWGKGGKKQNIANTPQHCDFHLQDWADKNDLVTLVAKDCLEPMLWEPADAALAATTQTLTVDSVMAAPSPWAGATQGALVDADDVRATFDIDPTAHDLQVTVTNPTSSLGVISTVLIKAQVSVSGASNPNDGFRLKACLNGGTCGSASQKAGDKPSDTNITFEASRPGGGSWAWSDISNLEPVLALEKTGPRDGTWHVDRIWVEVTSGGTAPNGGGNSAKCYNTNGKACLQAFKMSDPVGYNRITAIQSLGSDTYRLTLNATLSEDWYFQLSKNPTNPDTDKLLAKAYIFSMDQLRWVRDEGLTTWLEGGAVFATRSGTHYLHTPPIFDESITGRLLGNLTYYVRIIRFEGEDASISGTGTSNVFLRHNTTHSTTNDGVVGVRFDFAGEGAELWCSALTRRDVPQDYYYKEHPLFPCDGGANNDVRSVQYAALSSACATITTEPALTQCRKNNPLFFQVLFTEVLYDVTLRP